MTAPARCWHWAWHWATRLGARWAFRSPAATVKTLAAYAAAEQASYLDLVDAAQRTRDSVLAAQFLMHAADEARHARMLIAEAHRIAIESGLEGPGPLRADFDALARAGDARFLAQLVLGERRGRWQFEALTVFFAARQPARLAAMFRAIALDERRHEEDARRSLQQTGPNGVWMLVGAQRVRLVRAARVRAGWLAARIFRALATALALTAWPLAPMLRASRREGTS